MYRGGLVVPFGVGWLLLGVATYILEKRAKQAAEENEPYIGPLNGVTGRVPPLQPSDASLVEGIYLYSTPWVAHTVLAFYPAWVYWRGREPKITGRIPRDSRSSESPEKVLKFSFLV